MPNYRKQHAERKRLRMSAMGKESQRVQAQKRMIGMEDRIREMAEIEVQNLPSNQGDPIGCLQWHDFRTGKVRRWAVRIGDRIDRITLHSPDGRRTKPSGWTWVMDHLRGHLAGTKRESLNL